MIDVRRETKFKNLAAPAPILFRGYNKILCKHMQFANEIGQELKFTTAKSKDQNPNFCSASHQLFQVFNTDGEADPLQIQMKGS